MEEQQLDEFRQAFVMGLIVGIVIVILGVTSIVNYSINAYNGPKSSSSSVYLFGGVGCIFVGSMFIAKSVPAFIPINQQSATPKSCPYCCGAITDKDATVCEKCKQQLDWL